LRSAFDAIPQSHAKKAPRVGSNERSLRTAVSHVSWITSSASSGSPPQRHRMYSASGAKCSSYHARQAVESPARTASRIARSRQPFPSRSIRRALGPHRDIVRARGKSFGESRELSVISDEWSVRHTGEEPRPLTSDRCCFV